VDVWNSVSDAAVKSTSVASKKPGTRRVLKRVPEYPFQQYFADANIAIVPRRVAITVLTDKSLYTAIRNAVYCTVF